MRKGRKNLPSKNARLKSAHRSHLAALRSQLAALRRNEPGEHEQIEALEARIATVEAQKW